MINMRSQNFNNSRVWVIVIEEVSLVFEIPEFTYDTVIKGSQYVESRLDVLSHFAAVLTLTDIHWHSII